MNNQISPTKGNLMAVKRSLELAQTGYELLDRKRNILIRETMSMIDKAKNLQAEINALFVDAYAALQEANITLGIVDDFSNAVPIENGLTVTSRSVMGVEIPVININSRELINHFGFWHTNSSLDEATLKFEEVKNRLVELAETENSVYRLADAIKKTQKRANALKNIVIPNYSNSLAFITESLEEKEREDFSHMKVIKQRKEGHQ